MKYMVVLCGLLGVLALPSRAVTRYVIEQSTNAVSPYTSWDTASTSINDASSISSNGDLVLVAEGTYADAGTANMWNQVLIPTGVTVRSVSGAASTIKSGYGFKMDDGAVLVGFTVMSASSYFGGGIAAGSAAVVSNCIIRGNGACYGGGAVAGGKYYNCLIRDNSSDLGTIIHEASLYNCTVIQNDADTNGVLDKCHVVNSIFFSNTGEYTTVEYPNLTNTISYSCVERSFEGTGNITNDPKLTETIWALPYPDSPVIGKGTSVGSTLVDIRNVPRKNPPDMGCSEWVASAITGELSVVVSASFTNVAINMSVPITFNAEITGLYTGFWWTVDGVCLSTRDLVITQTFASVGSHRVTVSAANYDHFTAATALVEAVRYTCYVETNGTHVAPYSSWVTAATNLQDAIDSCLIPGSEVRVGPGVYYTPETNSYYTNGFHIAIPLRLISEQGAERTALEGVGRFPCLTVSADAIISGFTICGGYRDAYFNYRIAYERGGGVFSMTGDVLLTQCILTSNRAVYGGGAYGVRLTKCLMEYNYGFYGVGAYACSLEECVVRNNYGANSGTWWLYHSIGGGVNASEVKNCVISDNFANYGGGAANSLLTGSIVTRNRAAYSGGGCGACVLNDCSVYYNYAESSFPPTNEAGYYTPDNDNWCDNQNETNITYTCTTPLPPGVGNTTNPPWFAQGVAKPVAGDFDGDGKDDFGCYYADNGQWLTFRTKEILDMNRFGFNGTSPITGDFDGDGIGDFGCYYPPYGDWFVFRSRDGFWHNQFGYDGTIPVTGDFDGDGTGDFGCYFPPSGSWYVYKSRDGFWSTSFGYAPTTPIVGDFDGDGICDFGCYYEPCGYWYMYCSTDGMRFQTFGYAPTTPITGDFDGDDICDFGCYYAPNGTWYIYGSQMGFYSTQFGYAGTIPLTGDFDGDGYCDIGCFDPNLGIWFIFVSGREDAVNGEGVTEGNVSNRFRVIQLGGYLE